MKLTRSLLALSALAALSFGFVACDDDSGDSTPQEQQKDPDTKQCTATEAKCVGNLLVSCKDGKTEQVDCSATNQICQVNACVANPGDEPVKCSASENTCVGNIAYTCNAESGKMEQKDCGANATCTGAGECKANSGEGQDSDTCDEATFAPKCSGEKITACRSGVEVAEECPAGQVCANDNCVPKEAPDDGSAKLGSPCSCTGTDCSIIITGKELKDAINGKGIGGIALPFLANIQETDQIVAPNYFSKDITGCEGIVVPDGMAAGCFYTSTITFMDSLTNAQSVFAQLEMILLSVEAIPGLGNALAGLDIDIKSIAAAIQDLLAQGIKFTANNGYCMTADIDIKLDVKTDVPFSDSIKMSVGELVVMDNVIKLVNKINTVGTDHAKAKSATCPNDGQLLSFEANSDSDLGGAAVGFDMCVQKCSTDADCRAADGYKCIEMPANTTDVDNGTKSAKVCFPEENITYFEKMTEQFDALLPSDDAE